MRFTVLALTLGMLCACAPQFSAAAYSTEGAASLGTFRLHLVGRIQKNFRGDAFTTTPASPGIGVAINMGQQNDTGVCALSVAMDKPLQKGVYTGFMRGDLKTEQRFAAALDCNAARYTLAGHGGKVTITEADDRLRGFFDIPLQDSEGDEVIRAWGSFRLDNPY